MEPNAIVFDFDGVILESADIKTQAFRQLFENEHPQHVDEIVEYHLREEGVSRYRKFEHIYNTIIGEELVPAHSQHLGQRFSDLVLEGILAAPFVAGAREYIETHGQQLPLFIASGTPQEELEYIVRERGIADYFSEVHGTPRRKEEIVRDILRRHDLDAAHVAFVGDAESDLRAAKATGLVFVARCTGTDGKLSEWPVRIADLTMLSGCLEAL